MKQYRIPAVSVSAHIRDAINSNDQGIYIVYGLFIVEQSLNINRLYKGDLMDIGVEVQNNDTSDLRNVTYTLPVPEFVANEDDQNWAKYVHIHMVLSSEIKDDEEMMKEFVAAFAKKLSSVGEEDGR